MIQRTILQALNSIKDTFPVILITGSRQVGKTTLLKMISPKLNYVSLDDVDELKIAKTDPALFLQNHTPPVIIDEIQYAPELFSYIKIYVDSHCDENGLFWLSGSQKFSLMKNIQETLAGRVAIIDLMGFSFKELNNNSYHNTPFIPTLDWIKQEKQNDIPSQDVTSIFKTIWNGSFPKICTNPKMNRKLYYSSYIQTYISRDVAGLVNAENQLTFHTFIKSVAARTGQLLNYDDLARDVGVSNKTIKSWISILEASNLIYLLYPYYNNITNRLIKTPKIYFTDTGLCSYLTGWSTPETLESGAMNGGIFETYALIEILKSYYNQAERPNIYFYRDKDNNEVDFLIETDGILYPIEVKKNVTLKNIKFNFNALNKLNLPLGPKTVICLKEDITFLETDFVSIPIWRI